MGLYEIIRGVNNKNLFIYGTIIFISIIYFKPKEIQLNIILALIIAALIINYKYDKSKNTIEGEEQEKDLKREQIVPNPINYGDKDDLIDFLFSVQDWYHYNPQAYEDMSDNLESFFTIYSAIKRKSTFCDQYFQIADSKKNNALNSFHSIIYNIPNNEHVMDKFNRAHKRLETIMNAYLNQIYDVCHRDLVRNGYDITRKAINIGPKEANHYFDKDFSYQIY
jgi:hypothetical protein